MFLPCTIGVIDVIEMLIEHGADVNAAEGMEKDTALHTVVRSPEIDDNKKYAIVRRKNWFKKSLSNTP